MILSALPAIVLSLPSVQNAVIDRAALFASDYLHTEVRVGRISMGMFNRVTVHDFYVEDWDGDTLLYVNRADATIGPIASLLNRQLVLNDGVVSGGKFVLRETERGTFNVKEITDLLVNRNSKKPPFKVDIKSLKGTDIQFRMYRRAAPRDEGIDFANMCIDDIDVDMCDFKVVGPTVSSNILSLSCRERAGFELDDLSGSFRVEVGKIFFDNIHMRTARSEATVDYMVLDGDNWLQYRDYINKVPMNGRISNCTLSSHDVGYFAPALWGWNTTLYNITASMNGTVANFRGRLDHAELERGGTLRGSAKVVGLIDVEKTHFDIKVDELKASTNEISYLLHNIAHLEIKGAAADYLSRVQRVDASGAFRGTIHDFEVDARSRLGSGGSVAVKCSMDNPKQGKKGVTATLSGNDVDLKELLAQEIFGDASFAANVNMEFGDDEPIKLTGGCRVASVGFNRHDFKDVNVIADIENNRLVGSVASSDEALMMSGRAVIDWSDSSAPLYDAMATIDHADLHAMNINRRDSISVLRCDVGLSARGTTLDNMNGELRIAGAEYETVGRGCEADLVELTIHSDEDARTLSLSSDFADVMFESRTAYKDVIYYLKNLLVQYVPMLFSESARKSINQRVAGIGDEVAILSVKTKNIDPLLGCITDGLEMAEGSSVAMLVSPADNRFRLKASSEYLMHHNFLATNIDVQAGNAGDSLAMSLVADDLYAGMFHFSKVDVDGGAKDNGINLNAIFADSVQNISGEISARAKISRKNGHRNISLELNPSTVSSGNTVWNITTDGIKIDSSRVDIRRFAVRSNTQELFVDGVASRNEQDSVYMTLRNFSLAPFTQITSRVGYIVDGRTNGYATVRSALKEPRIDAKIDVDSIDVNGIGVPNVRLLSKWDFARSRASLDILTRTDNRSVIQGYFAPSRMRYYARMHTDSINVGLLDPLLSGIIVDTKGWAEADVALSGEGRMAELSGEIKVDSLATTIAYTKCRYNAPKATVKVRNNHIIATDVPVFDEANGKGLLSMDVSLAHLSNVEYDINIKAENMKVLNTNERDNSMFYGNIYASGTGSVRGDKAGVKMDFVAHSDDNSKFYMPLTDNSEISTADFVTFATKSTTDTTSYLMRKKMMFENRRLRRMSSGGAMDITMALDVRPNAEVQLVIDPTVGDIIKGKGEGLLNLRINPQANIFEMYGDLTIQNGSYLFTLQNIVNKWFDIEPGSTIQWTGDPFDAILNIDAVYKLKASLQPLLEGSITEGNRSSRAVPVECLIHLTDRLMQPTVTFDIVVPNADSDVQNLISSALATPESKSQQFLYLIIANSFISESSNSMSSSIGASATAATGFEMLSNQFSNWLSSDDYKIVLRYRPRTEQMSDEVDFGFSKGLINNRLLIEVEGNYIVDKTQVVNANSNFTGEAYLTWLIDQAGTLRLKGFTHTIDRFDENQGLQQTGIGIYFKEDFNNARDLRMRLKNRFKREKRDKREDESSDTKQKEVALDESNKKDRQTK